MERENLKNQLKEFLKGISLMRSQRKEPGWKFSCYEEIYLEYGIFMEPRVAPKELKSEPSYCYYNCQQIIRKRKYKNLTYVEGYAIAQNVSIPINHAWLLDGDGYAIDPTWRETGLLYFGIPLNNSWVKSFLKARRRADDLSVFTGNYLEDFSLLKDGLPSHAVVKIGN